MKTALRKSQCEWEMVPLCPWCGAKNLDSTQSPFPDIDGEGWELECHKCNQRFMMICRTIIRFETQPLDGWKSVEQPEEEKCDIPY